MTIYFSGIGGVGIGPLAEIAHDAGYTVLGSDIQDSPVTRKLRERGIQVFTAQSGEEILGAHQASAIDWFVYSAALPSDHPELTFAREHGIRVSKRDELIAKIIHDKNLQLIAVSGTHGKTTTTGMLVWAFKQLGIPLSYSVGTTLDFAPSGQYDEQSKYFVYECDEYDRNMLHFEPYVSIITSLGYDHPDTYKTEHVYKDAFLQFIEQSSYTFLWEKDLRFLARPDVAASYEAYDEHMNLARFTLAGEHNRHNAFLALRALMHCLPEIQENLVLAAINSFPGTDRRFEKLAENLYSDYGHHPSEIAATLQMASEVSDNVVLVYQAHQNIRQHMIIDEYTDKIFAGAQEVYWLPTYLSREDPALETLTPQQLSSRITTDKVHAAEMDGVLWDNICRHRDAGHLVLVMGAGSVDGWVRKQLAIRCSAEILVIDTDGNFVMQHRDDKPGITNPGLITSFGGSVESGENTRSAAHRELSEETNLKILKQDLRYLVTLFVEKVIDGTSRWLTYFTVNNQDVSELKVYEGQGFKIVAPNDRDNYALSETAREATDYFLQHADKR